MSLHKLVAKFLSLFFVFATSATVGYGAWIMEDKDIEASKIIPTNNDRAVCYNKTTNIKYTSIEKALSIASSGDEIFVLPGLENNDGSIYEIKISANCSVNEGVTLSLPYKDETYFDENEHGSAGFADETDDKIDTNRRSLVVINENVTLTVKGSLNIGGVLGSPNTGLSGQTSGSYCEIKLNNNSKIDCNGGTINCYGYIKKAAKDNNASLIVENNGILLSPFIMYDFKGGTITLGIVNLDDDKKYCPFQIFDFCNIQVNTMIYSGSSWKTRASVYMLSQYFPTSESERILTFIGPSSSNTALILEDGYMSIDYAILNSNNNGYTKNAVGFSKTTIDIYGKVMLGNLAMTISTESVDTSKFYFPISYLFDFNIRNGSVLNVPNKIKLMNGSNLTIDEGAILNLTQSLAIYDGFVDITTSYVYPYPTTYTKASFTNNGIVNVTDNGCIGGYINTSSSTGVINYLTSNYIAISPEYGGSVPSSAGAALGGTVSTTIYKNNAKGKLSSDGTSFIDNSDITCNYYAAIQGSTDTSVYGWNYENVVVLTGITSISTDQTTTCGSNTIKAVVYNESASTVNYEWSIGKTSVAADDKDKITLSTTSGESVTIQNASESDYTIPVTLTMTDSYGNIRCSTYSFNVQAKAKSDQSDDITGVNFKVMKKLNGTDNDYVEASQNHDDNSNIYNFYSGATTTKTKTDANTKDVYYKIKVNPIPLEGYFKNLTYKWEFVYRSAVKSRYKLDDDNDFVEYSSSTTKEQEPLSNNSFDVELFVGNNPTTVTLWGYTSTTYPTVTNCYLQIKLTISYMNSKDISATYAPTEKYAYFDLKFYLIKRS